VSRSPEDRLLFATILGIETFIRIGGRQYQTVRRQHRVLIEFVVTVSKLSGHASRNGVVPIADGDVENMAFSVIALLSPAPGDYLLKLFVEGAAAREGRGSVMVDEQPLAAGDGVGERLLIGVRPACFRPTIPRVLVIEQEYVVFRQVRGG